MTETTIWDIDEHRGEPPGIRRLALRESLRHLESYLDGDGILEPRTVDPEYGGNPLVARSAAGFFVCGWLDVLNLAGDSPLAGCEIQRIRDEDGRLFLTGTRDGETVDVEVRQLTEAGVGRLKESEDRFPWVSAVNRAHVKGPFSFTYSALLAMWDDPAMAAPPAYAAHSAYLPKVRLSASRLAEGTRTATADDSTLPGLDPADPTGLSMGGTDAAATTL